MVIEVEIGPAAGSKVVPPEESVKYNKQLIVAEVNGVTETDRIFTSVKVRFSENVDGMMGTSVMNFLLGT
jgi:hypothetical protein